MISSEYVDSLLAAQGHDCLLLSDDKIVRGLAFEKAGVKRAWSQALLLWALSKGTTRIAPYSYAVTRLARWRCKYITVNPQILIDISMQAGDEALTDFRTVVKLLTLGTNSLREVVTVVGAILTFCWSGRKVPNIRIVHLTYESLSGVAPETAPNGLEFLSLLLEVLPGSELRPARQAILTWVSGHFLLESLVKFMRDAKTLAP